MQNAVDAVKRLILKAVISLTLLASISILASGYNALLQTIPSKQLASEDVRWLLPFKNSFLNLLVNLRLVEFYFFSILITLIITSKTRNRVCCIVWILVAISIVVVTASYLIYGNMFCTIPIGSCAEFSQLFTSVLTILSLAILVTGLWSYLTGSGFKPRLTPLIALSLITIATLASRLDSVIAYILAYTTVLFTVLSSER